MDRQTERGERKRERGQFKRKRVGCQKPHRSASVGTTQNRSSTSKAFFVLSAALLQTAAWGSVLILDTGKDTTIQSAFRESGPQYLAHSTILV